MKSFGWMIMFIAEWLTDERWQALFLAGIIVRDLTVTDLQHTANRIWTCAESEFRLFLEKQTFSNVFSGYWKWTFAQNGLVFFPCSYDYICLHLSRFWDVSVFSYSIYWLVCFGMKVRNFELYIGCHNSFVQAFPKRA